MTTDKAATHVGCSSRLFLRVARSLGIPADETKQRYSTREKEVYYLWLPQTVDRIAQSPEMAAAERRAPAAVKALATKRANAIAWAESLPLPTFPLATKEELRQRAVNHYNNLWSARATERGVVNDRLNDKHASVHDDDNFLDRITVNYLRHALTDYEADLADAGGRVGVHDAKSIIRSRVLEAIGKAYPWLADECDDQVLRYSSEP